LPRSHGDRALVSAAHASAQHARESAATFVAHGWPPTFIDDLTADIERFEVAIHDRSAATTARASTRVDFDAAVKVGMIAVRKLNGIVPNVLRGTPSALAAWRKARRIVRAAALRTRKVSRQRARTVTATIRRVA